jgi:EARLY FLOWERING 3 protein
MKAGKDEEKIMGPMFPRLHVNDTEKGGPRAPPRNKMALYEQLSIPSQRFNPGVLPLTHPNNTSSLVLPASSNQGSGLERNFHPLHVPSPTPTHRAEPYLAHQSEGSILNNSLTQLDQRNKVGDEDDFIVPVFVQSGTGQRLSKTQRSVDREKLTPFSPSHSGRSIKHQNVCDKDPKLMTSPGPNLRQEVRCEIEEVPKVSGPSHSAESKSNLSTREKIDGLVMESNATPDQEYRDSPVINISNLDDTDLQQVFRTRSQPVDTGLVGSIRHLEKEDVAHPRSISHSREDDGSPNEADNGFQYCGDRTNVSLQMGNVDKGDDVSETSMVDSISGLDISPDDVVGMIGQKHFWKARRAISNQQRVFAVQVFELHRLIKVQQLIAESPHLLLENGAFLGKSSLKGSPAKKLPSNYVVKPPAHVPKRKDDSEKPNHKMECSAENAVGKTSLSAVKNGSQPSNYGPYVGNSQPAPVATDSKMGPWYFNQSPGHQWLIPVMSPSEGLVYKPYPGPGGPGFMGTACGGYGPFSPAPLTGNFMNPAYGVVPSPHHQGIGVVPGTTPVDHTYYPPYGMQVMNPSMSGSVQQVNQFAGPGSHGQSGQSGQLSGGGTNPILQHQSSCNVPNQRSGAVSQAVKFQASKDSEFQGSTASSPSERTQGVDTDHHTADGRDVLSLFPMAAVVPEAAPQPRETDQPTRVIKVVPHNPRSATESAARIFQSIQEERKQYDST